MILTSCEDNSVSFGTVEYYSSFLWVDENITPVTKTFDFDFSQDAQNDSRSYAEFQFVDNDGRPISTAIMQIKDGTNILSNNKLRVPSNVKSKELKFTFSPEASDGKHQGFLKLISHNLDRIDSQPLKLGDKLDVFQWTLHYNKVMNPLAKILMWILIVTVSLILLWVLVVRRFVFPTFRAIRKTLIIPNQAPIVIRFKGARMVILDSVKHKQSFWNKFWTGTIIYKQVPALTTPITFKPRAKGKKILFISRSTNYTCSPNPIDVQPSTIKDMNCNQQFAIQ